MFLQKKKRYTIKTLSQMERMHKSSPGLMILKTSPFYTNHVTNVIPFDSYAIGCILASDEAYRAALADNFDMYIHPRFSN